MNTPGRSCPLHYRYAASVFRHGAAPLEDTVYVIGGLYGNTAALEEILSMRQRERRRGIDVALFFNGDFNWFNVNREGFTQVNEAVLGHRAIAGNVEAELGRPGDGAGCGCAYPNDVDDDTVSRSNAIMERLHRCAAGFPELRTALQILPPWACIEVGGQRIGIVHGDAESLSGWHFAADRLAADDSASPVPRFFRESGVDLFACSHTCLPVLQALWVDGRRRLVANNGAAGMPNFRGTRFGLLTRISTRPDVPADSRYGTRLGVLRIDAVPIRYDHDRWLRRFRADWPPGSPAHESYQRRITEGPAFTVDQAVRCN
jgi:hypothetical protein